MSDFLLEAVRKNKIIAILRNVEYKYLEQTVQALKDGGIRMLEITFDQSSPTGILDTAKAIETAKSCGGEDMMIGAGTVMSVREVEAAADAGASFILAPNTDRDVIQAARAKGLGAIPGAMTPTEIAYAFRCGASVVKLFPSDDLGPGYIRAVMAPLSHIPLLAVGGVNRENIRDFLAAGAVGVGIGSNIIDKTQIAAGEFQAVSDLARSYVAAVK
ncbi:entner-Doudoroff aldolase [Clostridium sp. CAG:1013]|nr:entner-Doudoroff aldolase [Clostridium sp. CAG:1013]